MKADRLKLADVLQLVGIRNVLDDVLVQTPTVRVNKGDSEAGGSGYEPGFGGTEVPGAALGNRLDRGVQQVRTDIAGEHQKDNEEAAMQICPKQREWNQPRQQLCAARVSVGAGRALRYVQCDHEEQQRKKMGPCEPMNGAGPRR